MNPKPLFFLLLNLKGEAKHKQWMSEEHTYKCKDGISPLMWGGVAHSFPNTCHSFQESAGIWMTCETWCLCVHDSRPPLSVWVTVAAQSHAISKLVTNLLQKMVIKGAIPLCNPFIPGIWHRGIFDLFFLPFTSLKILSSLVFLVILTRLFRSKVLICVSDLFMCVCVCVLLACLLPSLD